MGCNHHVLRRSDDRAGGRLRSHGARSSGIGLGGCSVSGRFFFTPTPAAGDQKKHHRCTKKQTDKSVLIHWF